MSDQMAGFNARIKRIQDPRNTYYVDPETGSFVPKRVSKKDIRSAVAKHKVDISPTFFGLIGAVLIGALAVVGARYLRYAYLEIPSGTASVDTLMTIDFGLAAMATFLLGGVINQKSFRHMLAHGTGIVLMIVSMHNLVWQFPDQFGQVFSPAYVAEVQASTAPQTIWFRGEVIPIPL